MLQVESLHRLDICWLDYSTMFHSSVNNTAAEHIKGNRDKEWTMQKLSGFIHIQISAAQAQQHNFLCFVIHLKILIKILSNS